MTFAQEVQLHRGAGGFGNGSHQANAARCGDRRRRRGTWRVPALFNELKGMWVIGEPALDTVMQEAELRLGEDPGQRRPRLLFRPGIRFHQGFAGVAKVLLGEAPLESVSQ